MNDSRMVRDPVCGKEVDTLRARAVGIFGGVTYYFCSAECKARFNADADKAEVAHAPPKPEVAAAKPKVAAKPEVAAAKPEAGAAKPEVVTSKLEAVAAKPEVVAARPEVAPRPEPPAPPREAGSNGAANGNSGGDDGLASDGSVAYTRARLRRITGEIGHPVVQIDLSPSRHGIPAEAPLPPSLTEDAPRPARALNGVVVAAIVLAVLAAMLYFVFFRHA